jgi:hypothetical protein
MHTESTPTASIPSQSTASAGAAAAGPDAGWDAERDAFFRMTATLFPPAFSAGAGVLLASYDED